MVGPMAVEIRCITDGELPAFRDAVMLTFGDDGERDPDGAARLRALIAPGRAWAAFDRGMMVATAGTFDHEIGVPGGGSLAIAGLTMVTVRATHRRRGILRALMTLHLEEARARGVAVSGLWASEASIYGRFGYGVAAHHDLLEVREAGSLVVAAGRELDELEPIDDARARESLPGIYDRATRDRPGALRRSAVWWRERRFLETPFARAGASRRRHVVARRGDALVGYVAYRQRGAFSNGLPAGTAELIELIAVDPRAEATLWRFALGIDLFPTVTWWNAPLDTALPWLVSDLRRVQRRRVDNLWLRLDDIPAALAARRYSSDGELRLAVEGATYELVVRDGRATCAAVARAGELELDRARLASLYLGAITASELARAGVIRGDASAIAVADRVFASAVAPWCPEVF